MAEKTLADLKDIDEQVFNRAIKTFQDFQNDASRVENVLRKKKGGKKEVKTELWGELRRSRVGHTIVADELLDAINRFQNQHNPSTWRLVRDPSDAKDYTMSYFDGTGERLARVTGPNLLNVYINFYSELLNLGI